MVTHLKCNRFIIYQHFSVVYTQKSKQKRHKKHTDLNSPFFILGSPGAIKKQDEEERI